MREGEEEEVVKKEINSLNLKVYVVGSTPELGSNDFKHGLPLKYTSNGHYVCSIPPLLLHPSRSFYVLIFDIGLELCNN